MTAFLGERRDGVRADKRRRQLLLPALQTVAVSLVAAAITACSLFPQANSIPENTIVNGWSVGEVRECTGEYCHLMLRAAEDGLEARYPGHPPVARLTIHQEGIYRRPDGRVEVGHEGGGCCAVVVFWFADGTELAFGVGSALVGDVPRAFYDPPFGDPPFADPAE